MRLQYKCGWSDAEYRVCCMTIESTNGVCRSFTTRIRITFLTNAKVDCIVVNFNSCKHAVAIDFTSRKHNFLCSFCDMWGSPPRTAAYRWHILATWQRRSYLPIWYVGCGVIYWEGEESGRGERKSKNKRIKTKEYDNDTWIILQPKTNLCVI